jgi:hypothetical protein
MTSTRTSASTPPPTAPPTTTSTTKNDGVETNNHTSKTLIHNALGSAMAGIFSRMVTHPLDTVSSSSSSRSSRFSQLLFS